MSARHVLAGDIRAAKDDVCRAARVWREHDDQGGLAEIRAYSRLIDAVDHLNFLLDANEIGTEEAAAEACHLVPS